MQIKANTQENYLETHTNEQMKKLLFDEINLDRPLHEHTTSPAYHWAVINGSSNRIFKREGVPVGCLDLWSTLHSLTE